MAVRIARFRDEFAALGVLCGVDEAELRADPDFAPGARVHWLAWDHDRLVGALHPWSGPDGRCRLYFDASRPDAYAPLAAAVHSPCQAVVDTSDADLLVALLGAGFVEHRRELVYSVPTDPIDAPTPNGCTIVTADVVALAPLLELDCALRQDIPGSDGWEPDAAWFQEETYDSPFFDPESYRVALHDDDCVGLARVWRPARSADGVPVPPPLGCIGVRRSLRRRGLARALLEAAFAPVRARGVAHVIADVDIENAPCRALLEGLGASVVDSRVELARC